MRKYFILFLLIAFTNPALGWDVDKTTTISTLFTYNHSSPYDGDIVMAVAEPPAGCSQGFWLKKADTTTYKNLSSYLLSAFHTSTSIRFFGSTSSSWQGSGKGAYCELEAIALTK